MKKEPTDLAALLSEVVTGFSSQAGAKVVKLEMALTELPLINIDPERMREVVMNLITNAIRYTPSNGVVQICLSVDYLEQKNRQSSLSWIKVRGFHLRICRMFLTVSTKPAIWVEWA